MPERACPGRQGRLSGPADSGSPRLWRGQAAFSSLSLAVVRDEAAVVLRMALIMPSSQPCALAWEPAMVNIPKAAWVCW